MSREDEILGPRDLSKILLSGILWCLFKSDVVIFILFVVIQTFSALTVFFRF